MTEPVVIVHDPATLVVVTAAPAQPVTVNGQATGTLTVSEPPADSVTVTAVAGPPGPPGPGGGNAGYLHTQGVNATVWTIAHNLGYDPAGIVVTDADGYLADEWGLQYLVPGTTLRVSFDNAISGTAQLS